MKRRKPTIEDYEVAIIARDSGTPYPEVIEGFQITPNQFYEAVKSRIYDIIRFSGGKNKQTLEEIASDWQRKTELFDMGEEFLQEQYNRLVTGDQKYFYKGTFSSHNNVESLVYYALISNFPKLASPSRKEVAEEIKNLPKNLNQYFCKIKLGGLMAHQFEDSKSASPSAILEIFDRAYQKKTGDYSLFDLSQEYHLHRWGDNFRAPRSYWQNSLNVEEAVYHLLTEDNSDLASTSRKVLITAISALPIHLERYFISIGLSGLMFRALQCSPLAVLEVFDTVYQKKTGDFSLFDLTQEDHLHKWGDKFQAPNRYWKNMANVEEAVYHILTETNPQLSLTDRNEVISGINALPTNLEDYFESIGLGGLMMCAFEKSNRYSPISVLQVFDAVYQRKMGDASLFDKNQKTHLKFESRNRLIR